MANSHEGASRPPLHLPAGESDLVASLALQAEHKHPLVSAMLLEEIERAELHEPGTLPANVVVLGSQVSFVDEKTQQSRTVQLVMPVAADIAESRISIMTPMGAALYGMTAGASIQWPDRDGIERRITITRVVHPSSSDGLL